MIDSANKDAVLTIICETSDEIEGWGFNRIGDIVANVIDMFGGDGKTAGEYLRNIIEENLIETYPESDEVWISPEVFEKYCSWC